MRNTMVILLASASLLGGCNTVRGVAADVDSVAVAFDPARTYAVCGSYGLIDRNGDGRIRHAEWNDYRGGAFAAWDANGNGRISQGEFANCWYGGGFYPTYNRADWRPAFNAFDLDNSGAISPSEFFSTGAWTRLDASGTGYITVWPWPM
jgi:predicted small secreted protein